MRKNITNTVLVMMFTTSLSFGWGTKTVEDIKKPTQSKKIIDNKTEKETPAATAEEGTPLSIEEKKFLVINKLKSSDPKAITRTYDGKTMALNIPLFNPTIINLPVPIAEMIFVKGTGVDLIEDPLTTQSNILKIRSISPVLNDYELQLRLINNEWVRFKISTSLKSERHSKINILMPSNKELDLEKARERYFLRKYSIKNITKKENVKAVNLIVDRLDTESKKHLEQLEIEEKINKFILKNERFGLFLESSLVEPFEVVSEYKPNANTVTQNKEIILLNLKIFNFGDEYLELSPPFVKNIFKNYIAFYYDLENNKIAPNSSGKLVIVIEDTNPGIK